MKTVFLLGVAGEGDSLTKVNSSAANNRVNQTARTAAALRASFLVPLVTLGVIFLEVPLQ